MRSMRHRFLFYLLDLEGSTYVMHRSLIASAFSTSSSRASGPQSSIPIICRRGWTLSGYLAYAACSVPTARRICPIGSAIPRATLLPSSSAAQFPSVPWQRSFSSTASPARALERRIGRELGSMERALRRNRPISGMADHLADASAAVSSRLGSWNMDALEGLISRAGDVASQLARRRGWH